MLARISAYVLLGLMQPEPGLFANMCVESRPLLAGTPAPCTGLLISEQQAKDASLCVHVTVPQCQADLKRMTDLSSIMQASLRSQVEYRDKLIDQLIQKKSPETSTSDVMWVSSAMFVLGLTAGAAVVGLYK